MPLNFMLIFLKKTVNLQNTGIMKDPPGGEARTFLGQGCSSENFIGTTKRYKSERDSDRLQTLRGTIRKLYLI